jgi:hypothetical protein
MWLRAAKDFRDAQHSGEQECSPSREAMIGRAVIPDRRVAFVDGV